MPVYVLDRHCKPLMPTQTPTLSSWPAWTATAVSLENGSSPQVSRLDIVAFFESRMKIWFSLP